MKHPWIDTNSVFAEFCASLPKGRPVALDTEFNWTVTYFPEFALLQIGLGREEAALVDPLAITDWSPLAEILEDASRVKILFSGANDLPILNRACGGSVIPRSVFDIQLAPAFCGEKNNQSLKSVIEKNLGIVLPKSETRSDWLHRPLNGKQLEYAADDVELLPELMELYREKMAACGNLADFQEEMENIYGNGRLYEMPPVEDAATRIRPAHGWYDDSPAIRQRTLALAVWRERRARELDTSRGRILSDEQLHWCAHTAPEDERALFKMPNCWTKRVRRFAGEILEIVANPPPVAPKGSETRHTPHDTTLAKQYTERILGITRKAATERQIDSTVLCPKHLAESTSYGIVCNHLISGRLVEGWRGEILRERLSAALEVKCEAKR